MAGEHSPTINLKYEVGGSAADDLRQIRAQIKDIYEEAEKGINLRLQKPGGDDPGGSSVNQSNTGGNWVESLFGGDVSARRRDREAKAAESAEEDRKLNVILDGVSARRKALKAKVAAREAEAYGPPKPTAAQLGRSSVAADRDAAKAKKEQEDQELNVIMDGVAAKRKALRATVTARESMARDAANEERRVQRLHDDMVRSFRRMRPKQDDEDEQGDSGGDGGRGGRSGKGFFGFGGGSFGRQRMVYGLMNPVSTFGGSRLLAGLGPVGLVAAGAMGIANTAREGMGVATSMVNVVSNADKTASQKIRETSELIPVIGGTIKAFNELRDAVLGVTERIRFSMQSLARETIRAQHEARATRDIGSLEYERARLSNRAGALAGVNAVVAPNIDQTTFPGMIAHQRAQSLLPHQQALRFAQAELSASRENVGAAQLSVSEHEASIDDLNLRRRLARRRLDAAMSIANAQSGSGGVSSAAGATIGVAAAFGGNPAMAMNAQNNPGARDQALARAAIVTESNNLLVIDKKIEASQEEMIRRQNVLRDAVAATGSAEAAVRRINIDLMKEELGHLQQREQLVSQSASRLGGMSQISRMVGMNAFREIMNAVDAGGSIDDVPFVLRQQARTVGPNVIGRLEQASGAASEDQAFLRARGETGEVGSEINQSLTSLRDAIRIFGDKIRGNEVLTAQQEANTNLRALTMVMSKLIFAINRIGQVKMDSFQSGIIQQQAAGAAAG